MSLSFVGDISDKAIVSIGVVLDMLDTSIRKVDRVRSFHVAGSVTCLASAEHRLGIVVGHRVVVRVGRDLVRIGRLGVVGGLCWGMVGWGSVVDMCRSMVGRCSFDFWSMVNRGWVVGGGSIYRSWCMVSGSRGRQGPRFSIRMVIWIFCSDTVFVQLNQFSQILSRQCCLVYALSSK